MVIPIKGSGVPVAEKVSEKKETPDKIAEEKAKEVIRQREDKAYEWLNERLKAEYQKALNRHDKSDSDKHYVEDMGEGKVWIRLSAADWKRLCDDLAKEGINYPIQFLNENANYVAEDLNGDVDIEIRKDFSLAYYRNEPQTQAMGGKGPELANSARFFSPDEKRAYITKSLNTQRRGEVATVKEMIDKRLSEIKEKMPDDAKRDIAYKVYEWSHGSSLSAEDVKRDRSDKVNQMVDDYLKGKGVEKKE